jgi:hypothetical protein
VGYTTKREGTATPGVDYVEQSGEVTIPPGGTEAFIDIPIVTDTLDEPNETFTLEAAWATGAQLANAVATGTIVDDDQPTISVNDVTTMETTGTPASATFTVTLSSPSAVPVTVAYTTSAGTAKAADFKTTKGRLVFAPGELTKLVVVAVTGDSLYEVDEQFTLNLSASTNAALGDAQAVGTIVNDDPPPSLTITDTAVLEGNSGTKSATFTAKLSAASGAPTTVSFATADGTATGSDRDYTAKSGTITIPAGTLSKNLIVSVRGDKRVESNETFVVNLTNPINAVLSDAQAVGTITNDD